ncbi:hypothetical protein [Methanobrevibacter arboriphilus]|nr:hypothetical protein [Methanobrevibacter arboriphilus]
MVERGFIALEFDKYYNGHSSGELRYLFAFDLFVEDFSGLLIILVFVHC